MYFDRGQVKPHEDALEDCLVRPGLRPAVPFLFLTALKSRP
ncbi:hypothetical protein [Metabacillus arenae]|nr:hypothetical protein [Metabacillus arenae]